ncbi:MAG: NAD(P)-dependent oxidoreductase [Planctomycetaceae bacterium]
MSANLTEPLSPNAGPLGLVGLGLVGQALAGNLLRGGWQVRGFDVRPEACARLRDLGGTTAADPRAVFATCRVTLLSLPTDEVVDEVLRVGTPPPGHWLVDISTGDPAAAVAQQARLEPLGVAYVEAPLSGSSQQLAERKAVFFVGTDPRRFAWLQPLLAALAPEVFHTGGPGSA